MFDYARYLQIILVLFMKAMLIVAHGSRRSKSNDEIRSLTEKVSARVSDSFALIDCAFLELAEPSIESGIDCLVERGATQIQVVPYFLAAGTHVAEDIPRIVESRRPHHDGIKIEITNYLGQSELISDVLVDVALQ